MEHTAPRPPEPPADHDPPHQPLRPSETGQAGLEYLPPNIFFSIPARLRLNGRLRTGHVSLHLSQTNHLVVWMERVLSTSTTTRRENIHLIGCGTICSNPLQLLLYHATRRGEVTVKTVCYHCRALLLALAIPGPMFPDRVACCADLSASQQRQAMTLTATWNRQ